MNLKNTANMPTIEDILKEDFFNTLNTYSDLDIMKQTKIIEETISTEGLMVICQNEYARELIDKKYRENPIEYYKYYLDVNDRDMKYRKTMLTIEEESAYNQLVGICLHDFENNISPDFRLELLKRCYKWLYREIQNSSSCDIIKILRIYEKRSNEKILNRRDGMEITMAALQIAVFLEKPWDFSGYKTIIELCLESRLPLYAAKLDYSKEKNNRLAHLIPSDCLSINKFPNMSKLTTYIECDNINDPIMSDAMAYYIEFLRAIGLDDYSMRNVPYEQRDVDIITHYLNEDNAYVLTDDSKKAIISALFIILGLKKKYLEAKHFALDTSMEKEYKNALIQKEEYLKKEKFYEDRIKELELKLKQEKELNSKLKEDNKSLSKEIKLLNKDIEDIENNNAEVIALRESIYSLESDLEIPKDISSDEKIEVINDYNITIFGGLDSWANSSKESFPNIRFITNSAKNTDISFIKNDDFVFINVVGLSHSFYYKIVNILKKNKVKFSYIGNPNKELMIDRMYTTISNKL